MDEFLIPHANFKRLYEEYQQHGSLAIFVDFDNTIFDFHGKGYKYPMVIDILKRAVALDMKVTIFSANPDKMLIDMHMHNLEIPYQGVNVDGIPLGYENRKPFYSLLLDDRAGLISAYEDLSMLVEVLEQENL